MFDLSGVTALVTGGNSGVGLGYATGMARQGANIVIWGRNPEKNRAAEEHLRRAGSPMVCSDIVEISSETAIREGFERAIQIADGHIDCVVSNAGHGGGQHSLAETPTGVWEDFLKVHLTGGFWVVREAARHMTARADTPRRGGSILICGSLSVFAGAPGLSHYSAAKGGLASLMRCVATELGQHGVRVNMVAPGYIKTGIVNDPAVDEFSAGRTLLGRVGKPSDLEGIAAYLASEAACFHTGDIITIDGGWMTSL